MTGIETAVRIVAAVVALLLFGVAAGVYSDLMRSRERGLGDFLAVLALIYAGLFMAAVAVAGSAFLTP